MDTIKINKGNTLMIAHRGLSGMERENSMFSFIAAASKSYYGSECDIHLTKDSVFVISHDDNLKRVANCDKVIKDCTYEEIKKINLLKFDSQEKDSNLFVVSLKEYLEIQKKYSKHCIIEIKCQLEETYEEMLLKIIKDYEMENDVTFISFDINNLLLIRKSNKTIPLQFLTSDYNLVDIELLKQEKIDLDIHYQCLTKDKIETLHKNNILVNCWTVNEKNVGEMLVEWGVDFITTNILE